MLTLSTNRRSSGHVFTAGCLSGTVATAVFQPLDVIKTRLQLHVLTGNPNPGLTAIFKAVYNGTPTGVWTKLPIPPVFLRPTNFWSGTSAALWRCVPGAGCYFLCLTTLDRFFDRALSSQAFNNTQFNSATTVVKHFATGFIARSLVAVLLNPVLVVKTQIESGQFSDHSLWRTLQRVYARARWRGLFSGVLATITRDGPYSGFYYSCYTFLKNNLVDRNEIGCKDTTVFAPFYSVTACAAVAAFVATAITQPADVLRAHRQLLLASSTDAATGCWQRRRAIDVFLSLYRVDGITGFWRGLSFRLTRRCGAAMVTWTLYEYLS